MITIHQLCYNELPLLKFSYDFYKSRFPNATFVLHDNNSNDGSRELAEKLGYEIKPFSSDNQMDEQKLRHLRNNCWKNDTTDWVLVADMDELIDITEKDLLNQEELGNTIISTMGYQMINRENTFNLQNTNYGFRDDTMYDKSLIFNKKYVDNMGWSVGSHQCVPSGKLVKFSEETFNLLHFKYLGENYLIRRYKELNERQSLRNKQNSWCVQYSMNESKIQNFYRVSLNKVLTKLL